MQFLFNLIYVLFTILPVVLKTSGYEKKENK